MGPSVPAQAPGDRGKKKESSLKIHAGQLGMKAVEKAEIQCKVGICK